MNPRFNRASTVSKHNLRGLVRNIAQSGLLSPVAAGLRRRGIALGADQGWSARMSGWARFLARPSTASITLVLFLAVTTHADTWNTFRGNPQLTGVSPTPLPANLHLHWTYTTQDAIESTAAIQQNTVYIGSLDGHLYALDLTTGALKWQYQAAGEIKSSPTVDDSTVYFGDEHGTFHALDMSNGQSRWTFTAEAGITSSANRSGDHLYFGSYDQHIYCLDAATGAQVWQIATDGYIHSTPVVYDGIVAVAGCDGYLRLLDLIDGTERQRLAMGTYVASSTAVRSGRAYVGTFGNEVLGIDLIAGEVLWRYQHAERKFPFYASPAVTANAVIIGGRDKLIHALAPETGAVQWTHPAGGRVDSSPVIAGDRVYFGAGALIALDLKSGVEVWRYETGAAITASPAVAAGRLVIGATDGVLYCFGQEVNKP